VSTDCGTRDRLPPPTLRYIGHHASAGLTECCPRFRAGDAIDNERVRSLELSEGLLCLPPKYAVYRPWVITQIRDGPLKPLDRPALCVLPEKRFR
jgi:hypothetical protein